MSRSPTVSSSVSGWGLSRKGGRKIKRLLGMAGYFSHCGSSFGYKVKMLSIEGREGKDEAVLPKTQDLPLGGCLAE